MFSPKSNIMQLSNSNSLLMILEVLESWVMNRLKTRSLIVEHLRCTNLRIQEKLKKLKSRWKISSRVFSPTMVRWSSTLKCSRRNLIEKKSMKSNSSCYLLYSVSLTSHFVAESRSKERFNTCYNESLCYYTNNVTFYIYYMLYMLYYYILYILYVILYYYILYKT